MPTPSPLMASLLDRSRTAGYGNTEAIHAAAFDLIAEARDQVARDSEWLPQQDALSRQPEAAALAARLVAAALLDHDERNDSIAPLLMRLYRNYAVAADGCREHPIARAARYQVGAEPENPLVPDVRYLVTGAPERVPPGVLRVAASVMARAHTIGLLEAEHFRAHAHGAPSSVTACDHAVNVIGAIVQDATEASRASPERVAPPFYDGMRAAGRQYVRDRMVDIGVAMQERAAPGIAGPIAQHLIAGEGSVPDAAPDDADALSEAAQVSIEDVRGSRGRDPEAEDWIAPHWVLDHLGSLAVQAAAGDTHPGKRVAIPFPDLHGMHLNSLLANLPQAAHAVGSRAFAAGAGFAVYALEGMAGRSDGSSSDALSFAARTAARRVLWVMAVSGIRAAEQ